jgi:GT2 family glycosyltransferase
MGEDMTFCLRAAAAGIPVHVATGVQVGHMKPGMLGKVT